MSLDPRYRRIPFAAALDFLRGKISLPTDRWDDITDDEADAFFTVAGAKGSLLSEIRSAVEDAIERGLRPADFRARFAEIAEGWAGNNDWRADLIYRTNLRTAYARGREKYQLDPEVLKIQPYLQFIHSDAIVPRPHHKALDGQVFEATAVPFALPNGYGCGCRYVSLSPRDMAREGLSVSTLSRGAIVGGVPLEPEPGWDRMPGAARGERRQELVQRVIDRAPGPIAAAVKAEVESFTPATTTPTPYRIPDIDTVSFMPTLGEGATGKVVLDEANSLAIKYNKSGEPLNEKELRLSQTAGDLGVGPKVVSISEDKKSVAIELLNDYKTFDGAGSPSSELSRLSLDQQKTVAKNLVRQLATLHRNGIMHEDFHTGNAMFNPKDLSVKIIDYGLADDSARTFQPLRDLSRLDYWFSRSSNIPVLREEPVKRVLSQLLRSKSAPNYQKIINAIDEVE